MEKYLDTIWQNVLFLIHYFVKCLDFIFAPLNPMGPAVVILVIVLLTVAASKFLCKIYQTRRYIELKKEYQYWLSLRNEALTCKDAEKGKSLAKNIDQAKLNKAYYDYFFEGLLNSLVTRYLPILIMLAYVNEVFRPAKLAKNFGREYIFQFVNFDENVIQVGAVLWFVLSMLMVYLTWFIVEKLYSNYFNPDRRGNNKISDYESTPAGQDLPDPMASKRDPGHGERGEMRPHEKKI